MNKDPVCGMNVSFETAEQKRLYDDYDGERYLFCSLACLQAFQMNPKHFIEQNHPRTETGHCELCSKTIREGDEISELSVHENTYKFCCQTCSSVFLDKIQSETKETARKSGNIVDKLKNCGLFQWLENSVQLNASDLFLSVGEQPTLKVYGVFKRLSEDSLSAGQIEEIILSILPDRKKTQFQDGREIDLGLDIKGLSRFRINIFRQKNGNSLAIRPLPYNIPTLEELKLPSVFQDLLLLKHGLILITGPTGSGKTTTLASFINEINQREEKHIITIEDPIEYVIPNQRSLVHQREVGLHTDSFSDGLRNALRENPDIIVVGELRDLESISLAIRAAETGHLVLGTLHSGNAVQTLTRVLDVFDTARQPQIRVQLAQSLQAICSQQLLKKNDTQGMVVATEIMIATLALRNIIRQNRIQEIRGYMETGMREKMHTMRQSMQALADTGTISEEALSGAGDSLIPGLESL